MSLSGVGRTGLFAAVLAIPLIVISIQPQAVKARDTNGTATKAGKAVPPALRVAIKDSDGRIGSASFLLKVVP